MSWNGSSSRSGQQALSYPIGPIERTQHSMDLQEQRVTRIGILGGTFDPIHYGHLVIAEDARVYLNLEKVLFVPAYQPPHKPQGSYSPFEYRVRMLKLAVARNPHFALSLIETKLPVPSYTTDTVQALQADLGTDAELYFIMGMDSLANILTWHKPEELLRLCRIVVAERAGYQVDIAKLEKGLPGLRERMDLIDTPELSISSTDLQRRVSCGLSIRYQVPPTVERYIQTHRLYLDDPCCAPPDGGAVGERKKRMGQGT
jgi:nicotinate-nucleotide adenylyltransferase